MRPVLTVARRFVGATAGRLLCSATTTLARVDSRATAGRPYDFRASTPPVTGLLTPVVPGNVSGKPLSERTAR